MSEHPGKGVKFERIRRITGYLVGSMETWNNAKKAEAPGEWSKDARAWAEETGILQGDAQGRMMYEAPVTREQLVTVLYRQAQRV